MSNWFWALAAIVAVLLILLATTRPSDRR